MQSTGSVRRRANREMSQRARDKRKIQFNEKVNTYTLWNSICGFFPPQKWSPSEFKQHDVPMEGDRKEKNRIASRNSRERAKAMYLEMDKRLDLLECAMRPRYDPPLFDFEMPPFEFGFWELGATGWVKK